MTKETLGQRSLFATNIWGAVVAAPPSLSLLLALAVDTSKCHSSSTTHATRLTFNKSHLHSCCLELTMVKITAPTHSDDEFDIIICDEHGASDVNYGSCELLGSSSVSFYAGSGRLSGPHEVPQIPLGPAVDPAVAPMTQQLSDQSLEDENFYRPSGSAKDAVGGSLVNDGLKYTKSMYNKFLGKDALIAVMGYVFCHSASDVYADIKIV